MKLKTQTLFRLCIRLAHALSGFGPLEPELLELKERILELRCESLLPISDNQRSFFSKWEAMFSANILRSLPEPKEWKQPRF